MEYDFAQHGSVKLNSRFESDANFFKSIISSLLLSKHIFSVKGFVREKTT